MLFVLFGKLLMKKALKNSEKLTPVRDSFNVGYPKQSDALSVLKFLKYNN
jgi:hypothetical protein